MKKNFVYLYVNNNKETKQEYNNEATAWSALEYLAQNLYGTGKTITLYNARTGERKEVKA